jgi:signal transduction histidine kinase/ligand-binding sensor domain-containing protein
MYLVFKISFTLVRSTFLALLITLWTSQLVAQDPLYRHIGLSDGLMSQSVYSTFQDRDGYIWFATDEGACRYDGHSFTYFTTDNGLCDNEVLQIRQDSYGRIWLLTLSGCLCFYLDGQMHNASNDTSLTHNERTIGNTGITEDDAGNVYILGLSNAILKYNGKEIKAIPFAHEKDHFPTITFAFRGKDNALCFLNQGEVFEFTGSALVNVGLERMKYSRPNCVAKTPIGPVVISNEGLKNFDNTQSRIIGAPEVFDTWNQFVTINYLRGSFWFCLDQGGVEEWQWDNGVWKKLNVFLKGSIINGVTEDREKNLWFNTRDQGVYFLPSHSFGQQFYALPQSYQVTSIVALPGGNDYLVGADDGAIYSLRQDKQYKMELYVRPIGSAGSDKLLATPDGRVLCVNHRGVFWAKQALLEPLDDLLNAEIPKNVILDGNGGAYVAALIHCIHVPDLNKPSNWYVIKAIPNERVYHLAIDTRGRLWFEQHDKLFSYQDGKVLPHETFNLMSKGRISDIQASEDGRIVVATYGSGVFVLNEERIELHFDSNHGLNSNECKFILCQDKMLYMHTSAGLWVVDCVNDPSHTPQLIQAFDNLANKKMYDMLIGKDRFLFGTNTGLYMAPRYSEIKASSPQNVIVENINNKPMWSQAMEPYTLDYGQHVSIAFTAICYGWSRELEFEYRLSNLDSNWVRTTARSVDFSSMPWGTNFFQIRARHPHSEWTEPQTIVLLIEAPFYASWWFRSIVFVLGLAAIYGVVQYVLKRRFNAQMELMERDRILLTERNRISADLHDELGAEVSNIVILSRIAQAKIKNHDSPMASIDKIDRAANDMINKMNGIIWSLNPANDDLVSLVEYLKRYGQDYFELHAYEGGMQVQGHVRNAIVKGIVRRNIFLIMKEALQNVHKHANATQVDVKLIIESSLLTIEVKDNGRGFDPHNISRGRLGLLSLKRRAKDILGEITITSELDKGTTLVANFVI